MKYLRIIAALVALSRGNLAVADGSWTNDWGRLPNGVSWQTQDGNTFLRLEATEAGRTILVCRRVPISEGARALELSWRQRVSHLKPGKEPWHDARILLEFKDADGHKIPNNPPSPHTRTDTDGWVRRSTKFLVPAGAKWLEVIPSLFFVRQGTFDLDEISLQPTDPVPLEEAARMAAAKRAKEIQARRARAAAALARDGNLLSNGNFEADTNRDGWPDDWGRPKEALWMEEDGNHFLRMSATEPDKMILVYRSLDLPEGTNALELSWRQRVSHLKPGKEPWHDARILLEFKDANGKKLPHPPPAPYSRRNTDGWVERSCRFLVPQEALTLEFMPALFQVGQGTFDLDDVILKPTDPAPIEAALRAAAEAERAAFVPPETPRRTKWPSELHVEGTRVLTKDAAPVWLQGVNVVSLEFLPKGDHVQKSTLVAIEDWKSNIIRLPVKDEFWLGNDGADYRQRVDQIITLAANRGAYVLLDLHCFGVPGEKHAAFWKDAAARYKNHPAVLFDLFNEPHGISWDTWREQMQQLLDAVRATGARNIVVASGLDWGYDLSGVVNGFALEEKGGNGIIYATHIYPWKKDWKGKVLVTAANHPVLLGEVGCDIRPMPFENPKQREDVYQWAPDVIGLIQKHRLHWTAFSFHPSATPVMITGWDYAPTPFWGVFVKEALAGKQFELKRLR